MSETKDHWCVGVDNTGDITKWDNFVKLKSEVEEELGEVHLVGSEVPPFHRLQVCSVCVLHRSRPMEAWTAQSIQRDRSP